MRVCFKVENNVTSEHKRYLGHMFSGVHFNDSHNTQPSENYLNLLIARIFAIEFFIAARDYSPDFEYFSSFFWEKTGNTTEFSTFFYVCVS